MKRLCSTALIALAALLVFATTAAAFPFSFAGPAANNVDVPSPGVDVNVNFPTTGTITDLNLYVNIVGNWTDDISVTLSHLGTSVLVLAAHPESSGAYYDATFDDESPNPPVSASGAVTGTRQPNNPLSAFDGLELSGLWTLTLIDDHIVGDGNTLTAWTVSGDAASATASPEPGTILLVGSGLAGLAAARRRKQAAA